jgi:hypothetical protein
MSFFFFAKKVNEMGARNPSVHIRYVGPRAGLDLMLRKRKLRDPAWNQSLVVEPTGFRYQTYFGAPPPHRHG